MESVQGLVTPPTPISRWKLGDTVVPSPALGRIAGPPRPKVRILPRAVRRGDVLLVASIACATRCQVALWVDDKNIGIPHRLSVVGPTMAGVRRGALKPGELTVTLRVDDSPLIEGRSRFR
jgi:hypothetical protein